MASGTIKRPATPIIYDSGSVNLTISANSIVTSDVTFSQRFTSAPSVMLTILSDTTAVSGGTMVGVTLKSNPTTTGFTIKGFNSDSTQRQPNVRWLAIGT